MRKNALLVMAGVVAVSVAALLGFLRPRPTRIAVTPRTGDDTVVINQTHRTRLAASVMDQYGRHFGDDTIVRYRWISGDSVSVAPDGELQCSQYGNATVRATSHTLHRDFSLRCRPVAWIETVTWADLVVGDSAGDLSFVAHGPDGRIVTELRGTVTVENASIVEAAGTRIRAKRPGSTMVNIQVGDARTFVPIAVYNEVKSFVGNPRGMELMAMRVNLARGDTIVTPVPKAAFWVTYFSNDRGVPPPTIELRGAGSCANGNGIRLRRIESDKYAKYCYAGVGTQLMIAHGAAGAPIVHGVVAVRLMW